LTISVSEFGVVFDVLGVAVAQLEAARAHHLRAGHDLAALFGQPDASADFRTRGVVAALVPMARVWEVLLGTYTRGLKFSEVGKRLFGRGGPDVDILLVSDAGLRSNKLRHYCVI
jgi:hypothetical protein